MVVHCPWAPLSVTLLSSRPRVRSGPVRDLPVRSGRVDSLLDELEMWGIEEVFNEEVQLNHI